MRYRFGSRKGTKHFLTSMVKSNSESIKNKKYCSPHGPIQLRFSILSNKEKQTKIFFFEDFYVYNLKVNSKKTLKIND